MRRRQRLVALVLAVLGIVAGCAYYVAGVFFERRVVGDFVHRTVVLSPPPAPRALIIVIDGLRHDVALESDRLPIARELAARGASGLSVAEDPTMTGAGVRALGTGTPPAFVDVVTNKRMPRVAGEHLFRSLASVGHTIAVVGDHTWVDLFGPVAIDETKSGVAPLMERLRPAHAQDNVFVAKALAVLTARTATVTLVHLSGADAVSHGLGPLSDAYTKKLASLDGQLRTLVAACADCLVVLTSDHGASDQGHHGIGEPIARRTPLVLAGPGIRTGVSITARQSDVAPTLAVLLGAPAPGPARGRVLVEALAVSPAETAQLVLDDAVRHASYERAHVAAFGAPSTETGNRRGLLLLWIGALVAAALVVLAHATASGARAKRIRAVILLVCVEVAFVLWRDHATVLRRELVFSDHFTANHVGWIELVGAALVLGAGIATWRIWRTASDDRVTLGILLAASAALTDYLMFAAAVAGILAAALHARARLVAAAGVLAVLLAIAMPTLWTKVPAAGSIVVAWLGLLALAWWQRRGTVLVAGGLAVAAACIHLAGSPPLAARVVVVAILVSWTVIRTREHIGWTAAALLLFVSTPAQLVPLVGLLAIVAAVSTVDDKRPLLVLLVILAGRIMFLRLLEGSFSYSEIEWHVGRLAGAPTKLVSHIAVACKLALPVLVLVLLAGGTRAVTRQALGWALAWTLLAMAHASGSLALTAGTYHTPFVDLSALLFLAVIAATFAIAWLVAALRD